MRRKRPIRVIDKLHGLRLTKAAKLTGRRDADLLRLPEEHYRLAALIALGDDPCLLLRAPGAAPSGAGKHLQPAHRLQLGFGQKLSVRHVSNPLDSSWTIADQQSAPKVGAKDRYGALEAHPNYQSARAPALRDRALHACGGRVLTASRH